MWKWKRSSVKINSKTHSNIGSYSFVALVYGKKDRFETFTMIRTFLFLLQDFIESSNRLFVDHDAISRHLPFPRQE